jgi:hypothetical protein
VLRIVRELVALGEQAEEDEDVDREHGQPPEREDEHDDHGQHRAEAREADAEPQPPWVALEDQDAGDDLGEADEQPEPAPGGQVDAVEHLLGLGGQCVVVG